MLIPRWCVIPAAAILAGAAVLYFGRIDFNADLYWDWDLWSYRDMAASAPGISSQIEQPFAYRVLGPYLAGLLNGSGFWGFYTLTIAGSVGLAVIYCQYLRHMGIDSSVALFTLLLFVLNKYFFGFNVWNYHHLNDVLSLIYLVVIMWSMLSHRWVITAAIFLLGAFTRETILLMAPVIFVFLVEEEKWKEHWRRAALAILPGLLCFSILRLLISHSGGDGLVRAFLEHSTKLLDIEVWYRLLINSFVPVSLLPLVFLRETREFFRGRKHLLVFMALVFVSTLFGVNNERLMAPASVVYYWMIAVIIQDRFGTNWRLLSLLAAAAAVASTHHNIGAFTLPDRNATIVTSVAATAFVTSVALAIKLVIPRRGID